MERKPGQARHSSRSGPLRSGRAISPSGRFAVFEQDGKLMLFDSVKKTPSDVTDGAFALPKAFQWNESEGVVTVTYYEGHEPSRILLGD